MDSFRAVIVVVCRSQRNGALEVLPRQRPGEACAERRRRETASDGHVDGVAVVS